MENKGLILYRGLKKRSERKNKKDFGMTCFGWKAMKPCKNRSDWVFISPKVLLKNSEEGVTRFTGYLGIATAHDKNEAMFWNNIERWGIKRSVSERTSPTSADSTTNPQSRTDKHSPPVAAMPTATENLFNMVAPQHKSGRGKRPNALRRRLLPCHSRRVSTNMENSSRGDSYREKKQQEEPVRVKEENQYTDDGNIGHFRNRKKSPTSGSAAHRRRVSADTSEDSSSLGDSAHRDKNKRGRGLVDKDTEDDYSEHSRKRKKSWSTGSKDDKEPSSSERLVEKDNMIYTTSDPVYLGNQDIKVAEPEIDGASLVASDSSYDLIFLEERPTHTLRSSRPYLSLIDRVRRLESIFGITPTSPTLSIQRVKDLEVQATGSERETTDASCFHRVRFLEVEAGIED